MPVIADTNKATYPAPASEWDFASIGKLSDALRSGNISASDLLEHTISRIEALDQRLNAIVVRDFDRARESAKAADAALARGERRPLLGIPVTLKEPFNLAGLPTTWGYPQFKDFMPMEDALVVSRLKEAGAVLTRLQGFRIEQIADANIWMFWAECIAVPLAWLWASRGEARMPLSLGLALFAVGAFLSSRLTPAWQADDFRLSMIVIGFGQGLFLIPTVYYATRDVAPEQGTTAAALFNLSRVVGQTFGIAVVGSLITEREKFHSAFLVESLSNANPALLERFNNLVATFLGEHGDQSLVQLQAWQSLSTTFSQQAFVLAFADAFVIISAVLAISAVMVLMLPALREAPQRASPPPTAPAGATDRAFEASRRA